MNSTDNALFIKDLMPSNLLEDAINWIGANLQPTDVFDKKILKEWAQTEHVNDIFEEKEIIEFVRIMGVDEVFSDSVLEEWAVNNGWIK